MCAMWCAPTGWPSRHGDAGDVYNVGSGVSHSVRWLLDTLLSLTPCDVAVEVDPARLRPSDVPVSVCDNRRLVERHRLAARRSTCADPLSDLLDGWRAVAGNVEQQSR